MPGNVFQGRAGEAKDSLPSMMRTFVGRNVPEGPLPTSTRVSQRGRMWRTPDSKPLEFTAFTVYSVHRVAFAWRARFPVVGPVVWLSIVDAYDRTGGRMDGRVWGLVPFMRTRGADVEIGEISRYVSEMPWTPHSILGNQELEWMESGDRTVSAVTSIGPRPVVVTFGIDAEGDVISCFMADRPRQVGRAAVPTPWRGEFADYAPVEGGLRMPRRGKVWWQLPDRPFVYWEGEITGVSTQGSVG